jgi:hypothetical protein
MRLAHALDHLGRHGVAQKTREIGLVKPGCGVL